MWLRRIFTLAGSVLIIIGTFVPFLGVRLLHDRNYWQISTTGAIIILSLAGLSLVIAAFRKFNWLYLTGLGALGLLVYSIQKVGEQKAAVLSDISQSLEGSPLKGLGVGFVNSVDYRYGWALMLLGSVILVLVPLLGNRLGRRVKSSGQA